MEKPDPKEQNITEQLHFRQDIIINGLPYIFEGDVPEEPDTFEWLVSLPNWDELGPKVEAMLGDLEANPRFGTINPRYVRGLGSYHLGNGRVGTIQIRKVDPSDNALSIGIAHVQTETSYLPEDSGYKNASGIGSFLLDNLAALADTKKWRIYIFPDDRGGRLNQAELYKWYRRRGFEDDYKFPEESRHDFGGMQRWPKEPDISQVIATILQSVPLAK